MDMGKDREAFRNRFQAYKNGKSVREIYGIPEYQNGKVNYSKWDSANTQSYIIPFIKEKAITLTNAGRATGAKLSTNLLDSLADNAVRAGVPIRTAIGLATKESTLGNPTDDRTAWNISSAIREQFNGIYPGTVQHINNGTNIVQGDNLINYHKGNTNTSVFSDNTEKSVIQEGLEFYKQHPDKYNPGQPGYQKSVEARGNEVMNSPEVQKWYKGWEAKQLKVMRPKPYSFPTVQSTAPKKFGKYKNGKVSIGHNVSNAKINSDGTFTDDYTRTFEDMVVTPKRTELKRGSYSANNWNYTKAHRKDWMKTFLPEGVVNDKPLETVYPEFDLLLGGRQIATSILKSKAINPKNAIKKTDSEWDAAYMKAVKSGNMKEVQRLRDLHFVAKSQGNKAVTKDGMPVKTYHTVGDGYNPEFTEFNPTIEGTHSSIYTSNDPLMSGTYSSKLVSDYEKQSLAESMRLNELRNIEEGRVPGALGEIRKALLQDPDRGKDWIIRNSWLNQEVQPMRQKQLYVNLTNPVQIDNFGRPWNHINLSDLQSNYPSVYKAIRPADFFGNSYSTRSLEAAQKATGYDGSIIKNVVDYGGSRKSTVLDWARANDVYMVNNPSKLKLADPITYDDAGNIIPLSKRDNFNIKDIRYGVIPLAFGGFAAQK